MVGLVQARAQVLDRFDHTLVAMMDGSGNVDQVRQVIGEFSDALLSHLAYEENELLVPLAHSNIVV